MAYFRGNWPKSSITPKMHMLEDHVIPFLKKWRYGLGFYGEQGGESLHHEFKNMKNRYKNIRKPVECLTYMMNQHPGADPRGFQGVPGTPCVFDEDPESRNGFLELLAF